MDRAVIEQKVESLQHCVRRIHDKCPPSAEDPARDIDAQDIISLDLPQPAGWLGAAAHGPNWAQAMPTFPGCRMRGNCGAKQASIVCAKGITGFFMKSLAGGCGFTFRKSVMDARFTGNASKVPIYGFCAASGANACCTTPRLGSA